MDTENLQRLCTVALRIVAVLLILWAVVKSVLMAAQLVMLQNLGVVFVLAGYALVGVVGRVVWMKSAAIARAMCRDLDGPEE